MLNLYCNLIEMHRLRNELILAASETAVLADIYNAQKKQCSLNNIKLELSDSISFEELEDDN